MTLFLTGTQEVLTEDFSEYDRQGYIQFFSPSRQENIVKGLPEVEDSALMKTLKNQDTVWYDEESMVYAYQDSVETVVGLRANRVGRETGENSSVPDIRLLMNYFGEDKRFRFPFRTAAGTDNSPNVVVVNFWQPARKNGAIVPVRWWKSSSRGRWRWIHPVGSVFGEVLMLKDNKGKAHVFEIRTRTRYLHGWDVDVFRPFQNSGQLVEAIKLRRPNWENSPHLRKVMAHLGDDQTLSAFTLEAPEFSKSFDAVRGALDRLPAFNDDDLVRELLSQLTFRTAQGRVWRENERFETYAPSSDAEFSIVPKNYTIGVIPVNEVSCGRCHDQTGRGLADFDRRVMLYGEIWGEDRIFTWHLFKVNPHMFGTFDDADGSRFINPRMVQAGLVQEGQPSQNSQTYREFEQWPLPD